jgi:hypothetical protein
MNNLINICENSLKRLRKMDDEKKGGTASENLIFPQTNQAKGEKRISEQELRLLFIEELKKIHPDLFYSIEAPTIMKYSFGKTYNDIKQGGQSALLDLCIFERKNSKYNRILNLEFKYSNTALKNIAKDIFKLIHEEGNGAYIHLLKNTNRGTLCNKQETGVFNKLYKSFNDHQSYWKDDSKCIQLIIMSLEQNKLIQCDIKKDDLPRLKDIFFINNNCGNITSISVNGWK